MHFLGPSVSRLVGWLLLALSLRQVRSTSYLLEAAAKLLFMLQRHPAYQPRNEGAEEGLFSG